MGKRAARKRLVARLEEEARLSPEAFRRKVFGIAALGYGVLVLAVLLFFVLPLGLVITALVTGARGGFMLVFLMLPLLVGASLLRALWFRFSPPDGQALADDEAPRLREEVERVRTQLGAPPLAGIVIDGELNAMLVSLPRAAGLLGHRHYLVLGLPILRLLDDEELAAVIAHEFGHAASESKGLDGWIQRMRASLLRTFGSDADDRSLSTTYGYLLQRFFHWYVPYLEAYVRVQGRELEFQSDAAAVRATSPGVAASAHLRMELAGQRRGLRLERDLRAIARHQAHPPAQPHDWMSRLDARDRAADPARIVAIATRESDVYDSHPLLGRRLDAIGAPHVLRTPGPPAAELLGPSLDRIERALDTQWRDGVRETWEQWHGSAGTGRTRLAELEALPRFDVAQAIEHAGLAVELQHDADAVGLYRRVVEAAPDSAMAHRLLAQALADAGDGDGAVESFRRSLALDAGAARPIHGDLGARLADPDLDPSVVAAFEPLRAELAQRVGALDVREGPVSDDDEEAEFLPHALDGDAVAALRRALAPHAKVARAWVVRRRMDMAEATPHFIVLLDWRGSVASEAAGVAQLTTLVKLPGSHALTTGTNDKALVARIHAAAGEPVYRR